MKRKLMATSLAVYCLAATVLAIPSVLAGRTYAAAAWQFLFAAPSPSEPAGLLPHYHVRQAMPRLGLPAEADMMPLDSDNPEEVATMAARLVFRNWSQAKMQMVLDPLTPGDVYVIINQPGKKPLIVHARNVPVYELNSVHEAAVAMR